MFAICHRGVIKLLTLLNAILIRAARDGAVKAAMFIVRVNLPLRAIFHN